MVPLFLETPTWVTCAKYLIWRVVGVPPCWFVAPFVFDGARWTLTIYKMVTDIAWIRNTVSRVVTPVADLYRPFIGAKFVTPFIAGDGSHLVSDVVGDDFCIGRCSSSGHQWQLSGVTSSGATCLYCFSVSTVASKICKKGVLIGFTYILFFCDFCLQILPWD